MTHAEDDQTKPGPANPAAEGVEAPAPPGGPLRQDGAGGTKERAAAPDDGSRDAGPGGTIPIDEEQPGPDHQGGGGGEELQEENAETSLDQPSNG